jgi:YfiH family protein
MSRSLFTSREGGVSSTPYLTFNLATHVGDDLQSVEKNREKLAFDLGLPSTSLFFMNQVHGSDVEVIDENSSSTTLPSVDSLFTTAKGVALVTLVADCIPLLLHSAGAVAAVHVGRKGLLAGVFQETLRQFHRHGIHSGEIKAELGPSICGRCYEVDQDLYDDVVTQLPSTSTEFSSDAGKPSLDIQAGLTSLLDSAGVIWSSSQLCTMHDSGYFSYRRDGITGRQAGVIAL